MTLALPVETFSVLCPVQFIVNMHSQVLIILQSIHTDPLDANRAHRCLGSPRIYDQFFSLCHIPLQMVLFTPCDKVNFVFSPCSFVGFDGIFIKDLSWPAYRLWSMIDVTQRSKTLFGHNFRNNWNREV